MKMKKTYQTFWMKSSNLGKGILRNKRKKNRKLNKRRKRIMSCHPLKLLTLEMKTRKVKRVSKKKIMELL